MSNGVVMSKHFEWISFYLFHIYHGCSECDNKVSHNIQTTPNELLSISLCVWFDVKDWNVAGCGQISVQFYSITAHFTWSMSVLLYIYLVRQAIVVDARTSKNQHATALYEWTMRVFELSSLSYKLDWGPNVITLRLIWTLIRKQTRWIIGRVITGRNR